MTRQLSLHGSVSTDTSKPPSAASSRVLARSLSNASDEAEEEQQRKESEQDKVWVAARSDPVGPRRCEECISTTCAAASWRPRKGVSGSIAVGKPGASVPGERPMPEPPLRHRRATQQAQTELTKAVQPRMEQIVGSVNESREAHLERCQQPGCPRCRWYLVGHMWQATYGSLEEVEAGPMG